MKYNGIELVPIVELKLLDKNKKYLFWRSEDKIIEELEGGCVFESEDGITAVDYYGNLYNNVAEIPKPQKREMNSLEVMEYLHLLQLKLNRVEVELLHFDFVNDEFFKNRNLLQNDGFDFGVVVYSVGSNNNFGKWANSSSFWGFIGDMSYKFGILKNGKITEFEIPEVEVWIIY